MGVWWQMITQEGDHFLVNSDQLRFLYCHGTQHNILSFFVTSTIQKSNRNDNLITTWNIEHISILNWWRFKSKRLNGSTWGCVRDQMFWPLIVIYYQTVRLQCRFQKSKQLPLRPDFVEMIYFEMLFADKRMQIFSCKHLSQSSSQSVLANNCACPYDNSAEVNEELTNTFDFRDQFRAPAVRVSWTEYLPCFAQNTAVLLESQIKTKKKGLW